MNYQSVFEMAKSLGKEVKVTRLNNAHIIGKVKFSFGDHVVIKSDKKEYMLFDKEIIGVEILNTKTVGMHND